MADRLPPCVKASNVFQHPLLEECRTPTTGSERREQAMLRSQAERLCADCPFLAQCLSDAVAKHDVLGFVAGTTKRQRQELRVRLGINVEAEDLDVYAGVNSGRQYDGQEIQRLRAANPDQPLSAIAQKLGCSVSTVKRHLRRIEDNEIAPAEVIVRELPSPEVVLETFLDMKHSVEQHVA